MSDSNEKLVPIICPYCGVGCNIELAVSAERAERVRVAGRNPDLNGKFVCIKGLTVPDILNHEDRLTTPLVKTDDELVETDWDTAVGKAAGAFREIIDRHGPDSVGVLVSGKITNEEAYLGQKFARTVIKTNNVDTCARLCHSPSEVALRMQFGYGAVSGCINDFAVTDVVMLVGANTRHTHPGVWKILKNRESKNTLIVADIFDTISSADVKLTPEPGTDLIWLNALAKIIIEKGTFDSGFIDARTIGFENFRQSLEQYSRDFVEKTSGIAYQQLEKVADILAGKTAMFVWGMGLTQHASGTDAVLSIGNLAMLTGNLGRKGTGVVPLRGQNNVQGAVDMGSAPFSLPGSYQFSDIGALEHFEGFWKSDLSKSPGLSATEMIHKVLDGKMKALYIIGENPAVSEPQSGLVRWVLRGLELLVVQDIFLTETARLADIVLPSAALGEKEGTTTNADRRIQYSQKAVDPPGIAKPDWEITTMLAHALGNEWEYSSSEEIWDEVRAVAPLFRGAKYERLKNENGLFWPVYDDKHPGTTRLYTDRFMFHDGRARFFSVKPPLFYSPVSREYPYLLVTHRLYAHFNTGEMTRRSTRTMKKIHEGFVDINKLDADDLGLAEGSRVRINSPYGSIVTTVRISSKIDVPRHHLLAPIHFFGKCNFNELTSTYPLDPKAKMPSLKRIPVQLCKIT